MRKLLVLSALVCLGVGRAVAACDISKEFSCKNSKCIDGLLRCNGADECGDKSDETGCKDLPSHALPVGGIVTARVQFVKLYYTIELHFCGSQRCSHLLLKRPWANGTLSYDIGTNCNLRGRLCQYQKQGEADGYGSSVFPDGEVVLVAEHRAGELALWRQSRPDDVLVLPVEADYNTLRIRPYRMLGDMPVTFRSGLPTDNTQPQPGVPFGSVSKALVRVKTTRTPQMGGSASLIVSLCGSVSCCSMYLNGFYNNSLGGYSYKQQISNTASATNIQQINQYGGPSIWEPKDLSLIVQNEYELLGVRLESSPDSEQMWVQCPPDAKFLNVYSPVVGSNEISIFDGQDYQKVPAGPVLQLGELALLNVTAAYNIYSQYVYIGLCGDDSCTAVWINTYYLNSFTYKTGITSNNNPASDFTTLYLDTLTNSYMPSGYYYNVSVALHPDRFLQVWTPSDPTGMVLALPVPDSIWNSSPALKVVFPYGFVTYKSMGIQERVSLPNPYKSL